MNKTSIEYLDYTWNPLAMRCTPVSVGCKNCWHLRMANRLATNPQIPVGLRWAYSGNAKPLLIASRLEEPLRLKKPARIGVQFMGDLFHEEIPACDIVNVYEIMSYAKHHTFVVLTKRPERIDPVLYGEAGNWYLGGGDYIPNIWLGVSIGNQKTVDERIGQILQIPAAVHWVSLEPLLEHIDLGKWRYEAGGGSFPIGLPLHQPLVRASWHRPALSWVVVGSESGPGARPMDEDWVRDIRDQCIAAGTPLFYKQKLVNGKKILMPELDGKVWNQYPQEVE